MRVSTKHRTRPKVVAHISGNTTFGSGPVLVLSRWNHIGRHLPRGDRGKLHLKLGFVEYVP